MRDLAPPLCGLVLALASGAAGAEALAPALYGPAEALSAEGDHKWPWPAAAGDTVYVGFASKDLATVLARPADQGPFVAIADPLGASGDNPGYFNATLAVAPDGALHALWIDGSAELSRLVRHRSYADGAWSEPHVVSPGYDFLNAARLVVRPSGELFAVWAAPCPGGKNLNYSTSIDGGQSWTPSACVDMPVESYAGGSSLAAAPNGDVHLAYWDGSIRHAVWNGRGFVHAQVTAAEDCFDATVGVGPDGRAVLAFRKVGQGAFLARADDNKNYTVEPLPQSGAVIGPVPVVVDPAGNVHVAWIASSGPDEAQEVWYAVQAPGRPVSEPLRAAPADGGFMSNLGLAASLGPDGAARAHLTWEGWPNEIVLRYQQVRTACAACPGECTAGLCPLEDPGTTGDPGTAGDTDDSPDPTTGTADTSGSTGEPVTTGAPGATGATGPWGQDRGDDGCACAAGGRPPGAPALLLAALVGLAARRRRGATRPSAMRSRTCPPGHLRPARAVSRRAAPRARARAPRPTAGSPPAAAPPRAAAAPRAAAPAP